MPRTFTLLRTLGRGAHGAVHLAELRDDDAFVQTLAVKRLLPECSGQPELVTRLKDEARLLALLHHDHIVRVHGLTRIDGGLAILMEPIDGVDLSGLLGQPVPARAALEVVEAVADALDAAWNAVPPGQAAPLRVVHRDIKPSNIMVTARGGVKVMDFGVARATFDSREVETRSQQLGTARYMAPERWLSGDAVHESDVYSLGITLLELATGRPAERARLSPGPFAEDMAALLERLDPGLRELVSSMCAFAPGDRPTAAAVAATCRERVATVPGESLRAWASTHVVPQQGVPVDPTATGTVVREDASVAATRVEPATRWGVPLASLAVAAAIVGILVWPRPAPEPIAAPAPVELEPELPPPPPPRPRPAAPVAAPELVPEPIVPPPAPARPAPVVIAEPTIPTARVRFLLAEGLVAETDWGTVTRSPGLLELPAQRAVEVRVQEGADAWSCTIAVGSSFDEVRIRRRAEGGCTQ